jgi:hypothetical protein
VRREAVDRLLKTVAPEAATEPEATDTASLKESAATYQIAPPGKRPASTPSLIGKVATGLAQLSIEDIDMVARLVVRLQEPHENVSPRLSPAEVVAEARKQAALLSDVPRSEIAARFDALSEEIRQQAIARGVAIEGDWLSD